MTNLLNLRIMEIIHQLEIMGKVVAAVFCLQIPQSLVVAYRQVAQDALEIAYPV
jgi:hypothetical protein